MITHWEITAVFVCSSAYVFALLFWWHQRLVSLASRYDIPERRRRAARWFPVVMLLLVVPLLSVILFSIKIHAQRPLLAALVWAILPGFAWWISKRSSLSALGYFRQR